MSRFTLGLFAAAMFCLSFAHAKEASAQISIGIGDSGIVIGRPGFPFPGPQPGPRPGPWPRPQPQPTYTYTVTEYNPFTGGVIGTPRTFSNRNSAEAYRSSIARVHWVKWRFVGINEPLRWQRFGSSTSAQNFVRNDGPSRSGKLGFAILTHETRVVAGRVSLTSRRL